MARPEQLDRPVPIRPTPPDEPLALAVRPRLIDISFKTMLRVVVTIAACWLILRLLPVILVLIAALFLAGTLDPMVDWLERHKVRRGGGIATVFASLAIVAGLLVAITGPALVGQVRTLVQHEPEMRARVADLLSQSSLTASFAQSVRDVHYDVLARAVAGSALAFSAQAAEIVAGLVSAVFLALYMMIDRQRLRSGLFALIPREHRPRVNHILHELVPIVGGYIRGQVLTSALMTVFVFVLLTSCGIANALAIALFAGLADVLPYVGVVLSIAPCAAAAASHGYVILIAVVAAMLAYEELESRFLVPKIYGNALRLPSSVVLFALLVGSALLGIVGALLALPAAAAVRLLLEEFRKARDARAEAALAPAKG